MTIWTVERLDRHLAYTSRSQLSGDELHARRRNIIRWKDAGLTFKEIGRRLGITGGRVRQIYLRALRTEEGRQRSVDLHLAQSRGRVKEELRELSMGSLYVWDNSVMAYFND